MENRERKYKEILRTYLPLTAVAPIYEFIVANNVRFRITATRSSKLGDYRSPSPRHPFHEISVNGDLPQYFFLMVLLHEMAHLNTFTNYGRGMQPHGHQWQEEYRQLLIEYFNGGHFPPETFPLFKRYTSRIPLNHAAGLELEQALKRYGIADDDEAHMTLDDLPIGSTFSLKSKPDKVFMRIEKRRTRYLCNDTQTGRQYLISGSAEVIGTQA